MKSHLVERLRIKAGMIELGEKIPYGSDSGVMREAADEIERLREELKSLVDWEEPLHRALRLSDGDFSYLEADFAKARAALGEDKE